MVIEELLMKNLLIIATMASLILMGCASATDSKDEVVTNHDGEADSPIVLTLGQVWDGKVGGEDSDEYSSYYTFNTGNNTSVLIEITKSSLPHDSEDAYYDFLIYEGTTALESNSDNTSAQDSVAPILTNLTPNTDYTIELQNWGAGATTYQIQVKTLPTAANEGSVAAPEPLTLGQKRATFTTTLSGGKSYYTFNTGAHTSVTISYTHPRLGSNVYSTDSFSSSIGGEGSYTTQSVTIPGLQPGEDYYLAMDFSWFGDDYRCTFDLTVTGN